MKNSHLFLLVLIPTLGLTTLTHASHVTDIQCSADADGWQLCVSFHWSGKMTEDLLELTVTLLDGNGDTVETRALQEPINRADTGGATIEYWFSHPWVGILSIPPFQMVVDSDYCGQRFHDFVIDLDDLVPVDGTTWDEIKSLYR